MPTNSQEMKKRELSPFYLAALALVLLWCPAVSGQNGKLVDRIVAIVNNRIITQYDLDNASRLGRLRKTALSSADNNSPDAVLARLIEERIIQHELENYAGLEVSPEDVKRQMTRLDETFRSEGGLAAVAGQSKISLHDVEEQVRNDLRVTDFMTIRFFSSVSIEESEIERYYREKLPEQLKKAGMTQIPPLDSVRERITETLKEMRGQEELNRWIEDLKAQADITRFRVGLRFLPREHDHSYEMGPAKPRGDKP